MKRLLIDVSSLLWQSLLAGKDAEHGRVVFHEGKDVYVNSWSYGFECAVNHLLPVFRELELTPVDAIFVVEGEYSKARRTAIYAGYKGGRNSRPPEAYVQFNLCKGKLTETFLALGSQVVQQDGAEGDDCLAYLCKHLEGDKVILTTDGDMATLISNQVALWRGGMLTRENPYGPFPPRFIPVYKALVGDGNEYKGATLFGPKSFLDMLVAFGNGGLAGLEGMMKRKKLHELQDDVASFKPFQKVINSAEHVYESYQCALLHDEWCNTLRQPLKWQAGMVKPATDPRFKHWGQQVRLVTSDTYAAALEFFKSKMAESRIVALDIETSTPDESDEWLQRRDKATNVDVFGSQLTGMGLTFGRNNQYTFYMPCAHTETKNLTTEQVQDIVKLIPKATPIVVQNAAFELSVLYSNGFRF